MSMLQIERFTQLLKTFSNVEITAPCG